MISSSMEPESFTAQAYGGYKPEVLRPITKGWEGILRQAERARKPFDDVGDQCHQFFAGSMGFMWNDDFKAKYIKGNIAPTFQITLQKAFEMVAIFGPSLYHQNPQRTVNPRSKIQFPPAVFGDPNDPQIQQIAQEVAQMQNMRKADDALRADLLETYLNYTPDEMPGGGLARHSEKAITEALVRGRGVLWPRAYSMPGSGKTLTGCFWDAQENLYYDPDASSLDDAWWIAKKETRPYWAVEREFKLPKDSLREHAKHVSHTGLGERNGNDLKNSHGAQNRTNDLITYYRIWSKMGVGGRLSGVDTSLRESLDDVVGDYAYLVIAEGVPWPLNAPSDRLKGSDDEIERMFRWPHPFWRDDKWPCSILTFYDNPSSIYPIAPLAPGIGELTYLNIFISHLASRVWSSSRDLIAVLERAGDQVEQALMSGKDLGVVRISEVNKDLREIIQVIDFPNVNSDAWMIIDRITELFERRTGLDEFLAGRTKNQLRTAADVQAKQQATAVRPDYMAQRVEKWMEQAADMEKFVARWNVKGSDIAELVGPVGAQMWDAKILNTDPEIVVREMRASVAVGSMKKPNKEVDAQNMNAVASVLVPEFSKHADVTGDTGPINHWVENWGDITQQDVDGYLMGERKAAEPDPEVLAQQQQMQEQQMQFEMQKLGAEAQKSQLAAQKAQVDAVTAEKKAEAEIQRASAESGLKQLELQIKQAEAESGISIKHQEMSLKREETAMNMELAAAELQAKEAESENEQSAAQIEAQAKAVQAEATIRKAAMEIQRARIDLEAKQLDLEIKEADLKFRQRQLASADKNEGAENDSD